MILTWGRPIANLDANAMRLRDAHYQSIVVRCDHMFGVLFVIQWIGSIALAWFMSPYTWAGSQSHIHPHVWAAIVLGGIIISFPLFLILMRPGTPLTRHVVAVAQMLSSALLIHVSGGRIETHFHVFGSLAFLAFYRDWRVLVSATVVVAVDHFLRGMFWPESVFGIANASHWRWVEHAGWVIFEDVFLFMSCVQGQSEMAEIARRQEAADRANAAKSDFLARMSHEIRTPLNGVVGMIDLLRASGVTEVQGRYTQLARESADALMKVINDILDFSKIEAGKIEVENIEFDLRKLVEDLSELLAPVAARKGLALVSLLQPEIPRRLIGDPNRIRQVLTNLINNALKFTSSGSVRIRADVERQENERAIVRVAVQDTGMGIPRDRLDRLFKSFSQVDSSTTRKFGGTGLGLAISKRLVELMGGEIQVQSEEGAGTTFSFTLDLGVAATEQTPAAAPPQGAPGQAPHSLTGLHVLVAEDNEMNQFVTQETLRRAGCTCDIVADGALALDAVHQRYYDAVLMDCQMPGMDGLEASRRIRSREEQQGLRRIPIIALTAEAINGDREKCVGAGMDAYVTKPINPADLFSAIHTLVHVTRARAAAINQPVRGEAAA